jgi:hypothetical protein
VPSTAVSAALVVFSAARSAASCQATADSAARVGACSTSTWNIFVGELFRRMSVVHGASLLPGFASQARPRHSFARGTGLVM